jgi:hypothetical protein
VFGGFLSGVVAGISYVTNNDEKTHLIMNADNGVMTHKACQNALNNIGSSGFINDYQWEAAKLISKKYAE